LIDNPTIFDHSCKAGQASTAILMVRHSSNLSEEQVMVGFANILPLFCALMHPSQAAQSNMRQTPARWCL
jgi:hypothetical protein